MNERILVELLNYAVWGGISVITIGWLLYRFGGTGRIGILQAVELWCQQEIRLSQVHAAIKAGHEVHIVPRPAKVETQEVIEV